MLLYQAREVAKKANLDLVEVAPTVVPPVCRLLDYGKYKYEQAKKEREARKGQRAAGLSEIRLRPKIGTHDFEAKARSARKLLEEGGKVKVAIFFRGREITHPELGWRLLQRMVESLKESAIVEGHPLMQERNMSVTLLPKAAPKVKKGKKEEVRSKGSLDAEAQNS